MAPESLHRPFIIEIRQDRPKPNGSFVPAASLKITEELRTTGLLHTLPPEEAKHLLFLLTFVTPEGHCHASLPMLASAMRITASWARARMHRLAEFRWQGEAVVTEVHHGNGLISYGLHPRMVAYEHLTISEPHATPPLLAGSRNAVIAYSRNHYARPRAEVEKTIAQQLGHDPEETEDQKKLRFRLENVGLTAEQISELLSAFPIDIIVQQLDWLPSRHAKNPAGYLLAAVEGGYDEPRAVRKARQMLEPQYDRESQNAQSEDEPEATVTEVDIATSANIPESNFPVAEVSGLASGETIELTPDQ